MIRSNGGWYVLNLVELEVLNEKPDPVNFVKLFPSPHDPRIGPDGGPIDYYSGLL